MEARCKGKNGRKLMQTILINPADVNYARDACSSFKKAVEFLKFLDREATQSEAGKIKGGSIEPSALGVIIHTAANQDHITRPGSFMPEVFSNEESREQALAAATELFYKMAVRYIASIFCACGMHAPYIPMRRFGEIVRELLTDHAERKNFFAWVMQDITVAVDTCDESLTNEEIPVFTKEAGKLGPKGKTWLLYVISTFVRAIILDEEREKASVDIQNLSPEVQKFLDELDF